MNAPHRLLALSLLLGGAAAPLSGCQSQAAPPSSEAAPAAEADAPKQDVPTRKVEVAEVVRGDVVDRAELVGDLEGADEVRVFSQVADRLITLEVEQGDRVEQGQLLATVRADLLDDAVRQAQAGLAAARANRAVLADNLKRTKALVDIGASTGAQVENLEGQIRAADAQIRQLQATVSSASGQRSRSEIRAPIGGTVANLAVKAGDFVGVGAPMMTLVRANVLKAMVRVPERTFLRIEPGMKVSLSALGMPEHVVEAQVSRRAPVVDRMTRTGFIEVDLDNTDGRLVAGSAVRVVIELERRADVTLVPAEAVLFTGETERTRKAVAFVADGAVAKRREVTVGGRSGGQIEIVDGLTPGEQVVTRGVHFLRDGNPIERPDASAPAAEVPADDASAASEESP